MSKLEKQPFSKADGELRYVFLSAFLENNIVLVQAIGICPILAVGITLQNGVVLSVCTAAVLLPSSLFMSLLGERLPAWLRPPIYTVGAALILLGAAIIIDSFISHELYAALYVFLPLTAVNTLISFRAGGFSVNHNPVVALTDALASTMGFSLVICIVSAIREAVALGTLWGKPVKLDIRIPEMALPFAAFLLLGFISALLQWSKSVIVHRTRRKELYK